jgi:inosine-uridine nucleoside N-ribohydrolase
VKRATKIILDCDPGHDDAAAILYAGRHLDLLGITTVFGNQDIEQTTRNALRVCELGGLDVPVAKGASRPWVADAMPIPEAHGKTGLDGALLPETGREPSARSAVELIVELASRHRGELVIAAVAPLTNVATALRTEPRLASWLKAITIMGGSLTVGNVTPVAEFNIHADPEAAHAVINSGVPVHLCGLNVTRQVGVGRRRIAELSADAGRVASSFGGLLAFYSERLNEIYGLETASLHDPCALMPFIDESLITYRPMHVDVELSGALTRGMTVCDARYVGSDARGVRGGGNIRDGRPPNAQVAIAVDGDRAVDHVLAALRTYG